MAPPEERSPARDWLLPSLALVSVWQMLAWISPPAVLPSPIETLGALIRLASKPDFYFQLATSVWRGAAGFITAMGVGIGLGLWMGWEESAYRFFHPLLLLATSVPPIAWITLLLIWLGLGNGPPLLVVVVTTVPLVAVTVAQGVREVDPGLLEMATLFQISRSNQLRHIVLPALGGRIFAAAVLAQGFTWRVLIMAEFLGSTAGLGYRLSWARQNLDTDQALAYVFVIVTLSASIEYGLLRPLQQRWQWEPDRYAAGHAVPHHHNRNWHTHPPVREGPPEGEI